MSLGTTYSEILIQKGHSKKFESKLSSGRYIEALSIAVISNRMSVVRSHLTPEGPGEGFPGLLN